MREEHRALGMAPRGPLMDDDERHLALGRMCLDHQQSQFNMATVLFRCNRYEEGLAGYTYLEEEQPAPKLTNGSSGLTAVAPSPAPVRAAPEQPRQPVPQAVRKE